MKSWYNEVTLSLLRSPSYEGRAELAESGDFVTALHIAHDRPTDLPHFVDPHIDWSTAGAERRLAKATFATAGAERRLPKATFAIKLAIKFGTAGAKRRLAAEWQQRNEVKWKSFL